MSAADFPSGPWTGYFTYHGDSRKWGMDLSLSFENRRMTGEGNDSVGPFVIVGAYDAAAKECHWTKTYVAAHDVSYQGFREGKGIWGTWEIGRLARGGFHIWPKRVGEGETEAEAIEQPAPASETAEEIEKRQLVTREHNAAKPPSLPLLHRMEGRGVEEAFTSINGAAPLLGPPLVPRGERKSICVPIMFVEPA